MSDDFVLKMYEIQAELVETRQELERIRRENDELKNQMTANNLMQIVDDFQRNNSNRFEAIEENLRTLTTTVSNNHNTFTEIKKTLKEAIEVQKENKKSIVDNHSKLSKTVGAIQVNLTTLFTKVSSSDKILSAMNETLTKQIQTLRRQNDTLEIQREEIQILKKNMKTMEEETILLAGGWDGNKMVDNLQILQNNYGDWKESNIKLPYAVGGHGAQFLNNYLYIFGGQNGKNEVLNSTYKLTAGHKWLKNSLQWEKITDMNQKRQYISNSSMILNDRIWVIGGWNEIKGALKSVEVYDPQKNIWTNMKPMNECRSLAAAAVVYGKIFCCGGSNGKNFLKSAECYDPSSDVWTFISDMPGPSAGCGTVVMNAHLIVIGGAVARGKYFFNGVRVLDTADRNAKWLEKQLYLPLPRYHFSIAKIRGNVFVCGGLYTDRRDFKRYICNDVEIFDGEVIGFLSGRVVRMGQNNSFLEQRLASLKINDSIETIVLFDFETSGLFAAAGEPKRNYYMRKTRSPSELEKELKLFIENTPIENYPHIFELSFVAVNRNAFERGITDMEDLLQQNATIRTPIHYKSYASRVNPKMAEEKWEQYENAKKHNPEVLVHSRSDLETKRAFDIEWKEVISFLNSLPQPICLVAHNGLYFDNRILYGELVRYNLLEEFNLPQGTVFVDSLLAIQNIEGNLKEKLNEELEKNKCSSAEELLNSLDKKNWPVAFMKRVTVDDFKKTRTGNWTYEPKGRKYNLKALYDSTIGGAMDFHFADADCDALLQICLTYGRNFLEYMDTAGARFIFK